MERPFHTINTIKNFNFLYEENGAELCENAQKSKFDKLCVNIPYEKGDLNSSPDKTLKYINSSTIHICNVLPNVFGTKLERQNYDLKTVCISNKIFNVDKLKILNVQTLPCQVFQDERRKYCLGKYEDDIEIYNDSGMFFNKSTLAVLQGYITNNVKQSHQFIAKEGTIVKTYLYDENDQGWQLSVFNGRLEIRDCNKQESLIGLKNTTSFQFLKSDSANEVYKLIKMRLENLDMLDAKIESFFKTFYEWCKTLAHYNHDIDDISNKIIFIGPMFFQQILNSLRHANRDMIAKYRHIISMGQFAFLLSKKNCDTQICKKRLKIMVKNSSNIGNFTNKSSRNYSNYYSNSQQLKQSLISIPLLDHPEINHNQIKRLKSKKNQYNKKICTMPKRFWKILSPANVGKITNAGKNLNLCSYAKIGLFRRSGVLNNFLNLWWPFLQHYSLITENESISQLRLVINSVPTKYFIKDFRLAFLYAKAISNGIIFYKLNNHFVHLIIQSGLLYYCMKIRDDVTCTCFCDVESNCNFNNSMLRSSDEIKTIQERVEKFRQFQGSTIYFDTFTRCKKHWFFSPVEWDQTQTSICWKEAFCFGSFRIDKYLDVTKIDKFMVSVGMARKASQSIILKNFFPNKELSKLYHEDDVNLNNLKFFRLFTIFYDYKNLTVEDGYVVGDHVNFDLSIVQSYSINILKKSRYVSIEPINEFYKTDNMWILNVCKIRSNKELNFEKKKFVIEYVKKGDSHEYNLKFILNYNFINSFSGNIESKVFINKRFKKPKIEICLYTRKNKFNFKITNAYGQKGMVRYENLQNLVRENGQLVDVCANPVSILGRFAVGQLLEMYSDIPEKVYQIHDDSKKFIGYGGYVDYIVVNEFPYDNIHSSKLQSPMRLDRLFYTNGYGSKISSFLFIKSAERAEKSFEPGANIDKSIYNLFRLIGVFRKSLYFSTLPHIDDGNLLRPSSETCRSRGYQDISSETTKTRNGKSKQEKEISKIVKRRREEKIPKRRDGSKENQKFGTQSIEGGRKKRETIGEDETKFISKRRKISK